MLVSRVDDGLELRLLEEPHAEALWGLREGYHPQPQTNEWWFSGACLEHAVRFIRGHLKTFAEGRGFAAGVWEHDQLGGLTVLRLGGLVQVPHSMTASLDYGLAPAFRGRAIMTRCCASLLDYAFQNYQVNRVEITPDAANTKSCAIPEQLGMKSEGVLRQTVWHDSFCGDVAVYSLLRSK